MEAGIVLFAFAMKTMLAHVGDELGTIPAVRLCGGTTLYLFVYVALRRRGARTLDGGRFLAALAGAALVSVAVTGSRSHPESETREPIDSCEAPARVSTQI